MVQSPPITIDRDHLIFLLKDLGNTSAWAVYIYLWTQSIDFGKPSVAKSVGQIMRATGFSKSTVQGSLRLLNQRGLITSTRETAYTVTVHVVHR